MSIHLTQRKCWMWCSMPLLQNELKRPCCWYVGIVVVENNILSCWQGSGNTAHQPVGHHQMLFCCLWSISGITGSGVEAGQKLMNPHKFHNSLSASTLGFITWRGFTYRSIPKHVPPHSLVIVKYWNKYRQWLYLSKKSKCGQPKHCKDTFQEN